LHQQFPGPRPHSKALTFTLSTPTSAPPARRPHFAPGLTKYSTVKMSRAGAQAAVESLEVAYEGSRKPPR
jgi:hypothetical protein